MCAFHINGYQLIPGSLLSTGIWESIIWLPLHFCFKLMGAYSWSLWTFVEDKIQHIHRTLGHVYCWVMINTLIMTQQSCLLLDHVYCWIIFTVPSYLLLDHIYCWIMFIVWSCLLFDHVYCLIMFIVGSCLLFDHVYCLIMFIVWSCLLWIMFSVRSY